MKRNHRYAIIVLITTTLGILLCLELLFRTIGVLPAFLSLSEDQFRARKASTAMLYPPSRPFFNAVDMSREPLADSNIELMHFPAREYAYPRSKPDGSFRIIGMGDSFAWGWGVFDNRFTMFKLLEFWLSIMGENFRSFEVINAAQPGAAMEFYRQFLFDFVLDMGPDMVLLVLNLNDIECYHASVPVEANVRKIIEGHTDRLSRYSKLIQFIQYRWTRTKVRDFMVNDYHASYFGDKLVRWQLGKQALLDIKNICQQNNITLVIVTFPLLYDLDKEYPFSREIDIISSFCLQNDIYHINLLPNFMGKEPSRLWVLPADSHPNEIAHRIAAETIYVFLKEQDLLPLRDWTSEVHNQ